MGEHTHLPIKVRMLPNGSDDETLAYYVMACKGCNAILREVEEGTNEG